jgi:hypothetical protein
MQIKETTVYIKAEPKEKLCEDIYYVQLLENSYHKCPFCVSGKKLP